MQKLTLPPRQFGAIAELRVAQMLRKRGMSPVYWRHPNSPIRDGNDWWDINADGRLIDVKASSFRKTTGSWTFNPRRISKLHRLTAFVLCLRAVPGVQSRWIYLIVPWEHLAGKQTFKVGILQLLRGEFAQYLDNWDFILNAPRLR